MVSNVIRKAQLFRIIGFSKTPKYSTSWRAVSSFSKALTHLANCSGVKIKVRGESHLVLCTMTDFYRELSLSFICSLFATIS